MGEVDTSKDLSHCIQKSPLREDFEQVRWEKGKEPATFEWSKVSNEKTLKLDGNLMIPFWTLQIKRQNCLPWVVLLI